SLEADAENRLILQLAALLRKCCSGAKRRPDVHPQLLPFRVDRPRSRYARGVGSLEKTMLNPRALTHAELAAIVADVQAILWRESRLLPDDPRQYGDYWNPAKEGEAE